MASAPIGYGKVSSYVLTRDSERHLEQLLERLAEFSDELIVVDSGSTDATLAMARRHGCRILYRAFDNFRSQREFAIAQCSGDYVFFCDSDEIPSDRLVEWMRKTKRTGFAHALYSFRRNWFAFGRPVRAFYPIRECPDHVVRLARRDVATYCGSRTVHERYDDCATAVGVDVAIDHYSIETDGELERKLQLYTELAAGEIVKQRARAVGLLRLSCVIRPPAAFLKFYLIAGGFLDGRVGLQLARYAARYTQLKYKRAIDRILGPAPVAVGRIGGKPRPSITSTN